MMIKRNLSSIGMSLAEVTAGILLLADPAGFAAGIMTALGVLLMIIGASKTVRYFRTEPEEAAFSLILVKGLRMLLAGAFCVFASRRGAGTFPVLTSAYGAVILLIGITKVQWTVDIIRMKRSKWLWQAVSAAIAVSCGIVTVADPFSTGAALWIFIGISLIAEAVFDMVGGIFGNREKKEDETEKSHP